MIKSLTLKNFQSHENSILQFSDGVNIIIGASDSGKTAIIRALRWGVWNRPSGDAFRSNWGGETAVHIETEEGVVIRSKDKEDRYILEQEGHPRLELKAFGTSVPEEVSGLLNISEINLQMQLDSPFLLSETPGAVATHFNKVARLDKIDLSTQNINSAINQISGAIGSEAKKNKPATGLIKRIADTETELTTFDYLEEFEVAVIALELLEKELDQKKTDRTELDTLISVLSETEYLIEDESKILDAEFQLNDVLALIAVRKEMAIKADKIDTVIENIKEVSEIMLQNDLITILETPTLDLLKLYESKRKATNDRLPLYRLCTNVRSVQERLTVAISNNATLQSRFDIAFPETCPLCGKPK